MVSGDILAGTLLVFEAIRMMTSHCRAQILRTRLADLATTAALEHARRVRAAHTRMQRAGTPAVCCALLGHTQRRRELPAVRFASVAGARWGLARLSAT